MISKLIKALRDKDKIQVVKTEQIFDDLPESIESFTKPPKNAVQTSQDELDKWLSKNPELRVRA